MNESKLTARKLLMLRLGYSVVDLSRKDLQIFWEKLIKEGKLPKKEEPMGHSRRRDRPGRKKHTKKCGTCGKDITGNSLLITCESCLDKIPLLHNKHEKLSMNIPKMTKE